MIVQCIFSVGHVHKKMKILENNQQGTSSRTALVEDRMNVVEDRVNVVEDSVNVVEDRVNVVKDRVNVVEDRVNVVEDSVHQLQGDLSIFFISLQKGLSRHIL